MALPPGVTTCTITFPPSYDEKGRAKFNRLTGLIYPTEQVRIKATGRVVITDPIPVYFDRDGRGFAVVPHTNLSIYTDSFQYTVAWAVSPGAETPGYKEFAVPSTIGQTALFSSLTRTEAPVGGGTGGLSEAQVVEGLADPASPIAQAARETLVAKWRPSTAYAAGEAIVNPEGYVVTALAAHTTSSAYTPSRYSVPVTATPPLSAVVGLQTALDAKATKTEVATVTTALTDKANRSEVAAIATAVDSKATKAELNTVASSVTGKANRSEVSDLALVVSEKAVKAEVASALADKQDKASLPADVVANLPTRLSDAVLKETFLSPAKAVEKFLPVESVRLDDTDRSIAVLRVQVPITAPPAVDPEDPNTPVDPTPNPSPGVAIDALMPHPYYTPREGDPYVPLVVDRPPSKNGVPVGKLAAPSLHGWPDETNTGLAVNGVASTALLPVAGTVEFTASGVTIGTTKYPRPSTGSSTPVPGITLYPVGAGVTHPKHFAPIHNLVDHARVAGTVIQKGNLSTLVLDSMIVGVGGKGGWYNDVGGYGAGGKGQAAGFMILANSRIHGGRTAQSTSNGFRWWAHHCNISGGNDTFEPFTNCYADFNYTHGLIKVGSFHNDFCQITKCTGDPVISALFNGWNIRIRKNTGLAYGEKNGAQWLMLGNQQGDMDKVLVSENLGFGGVVMIGDGLGGYRSYGTNSDGTPKTQLSSITGKQETHAFTQYVVIERNVFGRKDGDSWPGGGRPAGSKVPTDRVADPGMYQYSGGGIWNDPPPYTLRDNVWDDTSTAACANGGHGYPAATANGWPTLEQVAVAQSLSFDVYPSGMPS